MTGPQLGCLHRGGHYRSTQSERGEVSLVSHSQHPRTTVPDAVALGFPSWLLSYPTPPPGPGGMFPPLVVRAGDLIKGAE
jgi:hypothetical protein